jgi:hypothetical protein
MQLARVSPIILPSSHKAGFRHQSASESIVTREREDDGGCEGRIFTPVIESHGQTLEFDFFEFLSLDLLDTLP